MPGAGMPGGFYPGAEFLYVPSVEEYWHLSTVIDGGTGESMEVNTTPIKPYVHKNIKEEQALRNTFRNEYPWA